MLDTDCTSTDWCDCFDVHTLFFEHFIKLIVNIIDFQKITIFDMSKKAFSFTVQYVQSFFYKKGKKRQNWSKSYRCLCKC